MAPRLSLEAAKEVQGRLCLSCGKPRVSLIHGRVVLYLTTSRKVKRLVCLKCWKKKNPREILKLAEGVMGGEVTFEKRNPMGRCRRIRRFTKDPAPVQSTDNVMKEEPDGADEWTHGETEA